MDRIVHEVTELNRTERLSLSHTVLFQASVQFSHSVVSDSIGASASAISPSSEDSGLTSFRIDWFDPLGIQGTL